MNQEIINEMWNFARGMQSVLNESNFEINVQYLKQAGDWLQRMICKFKISKHWSLCFWVFFFLAGGFYVGIRVCKVTMSSLDNFWKPPKNRFC